VKWKNKGISRDKQKGAKYTKSKLHIVIIKEGFLNNKGYAWIEKFLKTIIKSL
jgi:hypothetical protein